MTDKNLMSEEQLVVFELDGESYGVEISRVQEIDRMASITLVPQSPIFVKGVINLRGRITPVVDLRARFGLPEQETTTLTRIVVVKSGEEWIGLVVDAVSEVLRISLDAIEPPSAMITTTDSAYLRGIAKLKERIIILLDLDRVLDRAFQPMTLVAA
jgi:purine-binding chemotaxis protein CheW